MYRQLAALLLMGVMVGAGLAGCDIKSKEGEGGKGGNAAGGGAGGAAGGAAGGGGGGGGGGGAGAGGGGAAPVAGANAFVGTWKIDAEATAELLWPMASKDLPADFPADQKASMKNAMIEQFKQLNPSVTINADKTISTKGGDDGGETGTWTMEGQTLVAKTGKAGGGQTTTARGTIKNGKMHVRVDGQEQFEVVFKK